MTDKPLKIILLAAGWATRLRPQTWSKPKPLISVAGKAAMDHLLDGFRTLPGPSAAEYTIVYSPGLGEAQIPPFMKEHYPALKVGYVLQPVMKGQSHALWLAREHLDGPTIVCFSDTLIETDFSFLSEEKADAVAWVKPVPDPRRFGVAEVGADGWVTRLVEKPTSLENNRVVVGCYYFPEGRDLVSAIEKHFEAGPERKGEYFLTDTLNIMIERGLKMRVQTVDVWLDTGTIDATLETNRYLLERRCASTQYAVRNTVKVIPPVFIHATAEVSEVVIGPHVSIGAECKISRARIADSILEAGVTVTDAALTGSFIGRQARVEGRSADDPPMRLNIGDNSSVILE